MNKELNILLIEDHPADAKRARQHLDKVFKSASYKVIETKKQYLEALALLQPDLIISDYSLPAFDGLTALEIKIERAPFTPFIILTSSMNEDVAVEVMKAGADDYVLKERIKRLGLSALNALHKRELEKERHDALHALQESEERYRALVENIKDHIVCRYEFYPSRHISYISTSVESITGFTPRELYDDPDLAFNLIVPEDRHIIDKLLKQPDLCQNPIVMRFFCKNEQVILTEQSVTLLYNDDGRLIAFESIVRDITERSKAQESLVREKKFTDSALDAQMDVFYLFEPLTKKAVRWNAAFRKISGYSDAEISEMPAPDSFLNGQDNKRIQEFIKQDLNQKSRVLEVQLMCKNKSPVPIEFQVSTLVQDEHEYMICIGRDISERKKMEMRLQQTQKLEAIGTLAGGIAHDFNNMLSVVIGNVSYALSIMEKDRELSEVLVEAQKGARQAQALTQQLLTFSKGGAPIKKASNLNKIITETADFVNRGEKSKCVFKLADDLWTVEIDPEQINQCLSNIIINANQAMPGGGFIYISSENITIERSSHPAFKPGKYIKISIEDQGCGISQKELTSIFDPYFTTKDTGTGLGLATTYSIISRHGGYVTVYSELEKGSVFHIYLPASVHIKHKIESNNNMTHNGNGKILVMDDQEQILKMVSRMLNRMGYKVLTTTDGKDAIQEFKKAYQSAAPFDVVILDLTVPGGLGGAETIPELLKIDPNIKAVVSSGYSNDPIMANYSEYGFCGVVPKPFTKDQLGQLLNRVLDHK